jgi:hypothetical protein
MCHSSRASIRSNCCSISASRIDAATITYAMGETRRGPGIPDPSARLLLKPSAGSTKLTRSAARIGVRAVHTSSGVGPPAPQGHAVWEPGKLPTLARSLDRGARPTTLVTRTISFVFGFHLTLVLSAVTMQPPEDKAHLLAPPCRPQFAAKRNVAFLARLGRENAPTR